MYKYGIAYFTYAEDERVPVTGLDVRLVEAGGDYELGLVLVESGETGYYSADVTTPGYYEIWDDNGGTPQFSGRTCVIGPTNASGIADSAVDADKIADAAVKSEKISPASVETVHIGAMALDLQQLAHEIETEADGIGQTSAKTPAEVGVDEFIDHSLKSEYTSVPLVVIVPACESLFWIDRIALDNGAVTVTLGVPIGAKATDFKYQLLVIANNMQE